MYWIEMVFLYCSCYPVQCNSDAISKCLIYSYTRILTEISVGGILSNSKIAIQVSDIISVTAPVNKLNSIGLHNTTIRNI
jgi:hypothetical protein